jgi:hypothetical protein
MDDDCEACLYVDLGASAGKPLFAGSFADMCKMFVVMPAASRSHTRIVTAERTYHAAQLEALRREDEGGNDQEPRSLVGC